MVCFKLLIINIKVKMKTTNMNQTHGWSNSVVLLCCVLSFLTLPTNVINSSSPGIEKTQNEDINNHKNSEYASQKINDLLRNKKLRVRRQLQSALQLQPCFASDRGGVQVCALHVINPQGGGELLHFASLQFG